MKVRREREEGGRGGGGGGWREDGGRGGWRKGRETEITIGGERYELTKLKQSASQQMKAPRFTYLDVLAHGFLWKRRENEPLAAGCGS